MSRPITSWHLGQLNCKHIPHFQDVDNEPLYHFGYGLSYTTFKYSNLRISKKELHFSDTLSVSIEITNTGKYKGKEVREYNGKPHILESALTADFAFVKAWKGDTAGNLIFKGTARNFNPMMAMAGKITIAEVEELFEPGELDPNFIHTPSIFVNRIFQGVDYEKHKSNTSFDSYANNSANSWL